ncbi:MAG: sigma-54 dependent transcriptional regulator [Burkholderiaceae bacterium]|nr:sigma-54 dependent transcriptional regulator [Burkholderiaceae bacterium]
MNPNPQLCLIEDDAIMGESLADRFRLEGFDVDWHRRTVDARLALSRRRYDAVISDIRLQDGDGGQVFLSLLEEGGSATRLPPFVFITGFGTIDRAVELMKAGAADYVTKPFDLDRLVERMQGLCERSSSAGSGCDLGVSPAMQRVAEAMPRLAAQADTLLITGESGVGKEYVARLFHRHLCAPGGVDRTRELTRPFVAVNCAALPESLMEAELFGFERGAFTGANRAKRGLIEQADGGVVFLDEIGDMPLAMQAKLLRVLQDKHIVRLGGQGPTKVDFRLICATHRDLKVMVTQGAFREDLYYRINVIQLRLPPLRERHDDILHYLREFVHDFNRRHPGEARRLDARVESLLLRYAWPGNVRELKNAVERACILSHTALLSPEAFFSDLLSDKEPAAPELSRSLAAYLATVEREFIQGVLQEHDGQIARSAEALGISRKNLWERMRRLGLSQGKAEVPPAG